MRFVVRIYYSEIIITKLLQQQYEGDKSKREQTYRTFESYKLEHKSTKAGELFREFTMHLDTFASCCWLLTFAEFLYENLKSKRESFNWTPSSGFAMNFCSNRVQ